MVLNCYPAHPHRFLWVFFQLEDSCEVGQSDASIREALRNLPNGLAETYTRILNKIESRPPRITELAQRMLKWVVCARRPLLVEELKEAIAFEPGDRSWDNEKIPAESNEKRFIQICGNLMFLDEEEGTVRLAHHTVQQYMLSTPKSSTSHQYHFQLAEAQLYAGEICVTYLSFSDFETQITESRPRQLASGFFSSAGLAYIPSILGYGSRLFDAWYQLRGGSVKHKSPNIDYMSVLMPKSYQKKPPGRSFSQKYRFLNYTIENWLYHTSFFSADNTKFWGSFRSLAVEKTLPFQFRDWDFDGEPMKVPYWRLYEWASREGHEPLIRLLLKPSPSHPPLHTYLEHDLCLTEKLLHCAVHGYADVLQQLLLCLDNIPKTIAGHGWKGFRNEDEMIVRLLRLMFENKASLNANSKPLLCAAERGQTELVLRLLEHGAPVDQHNSLGFTVLHYAARNGHEVILRAALKAGAKVGAKTFDRQKTPLHFAAIGGYTMLAQLLVESGADFNATATDNQSALLFAAAHGQTAMVQKLVEFGASVQARTSGGFTALHFAASAGDTTLTQWLLLQGADIEVRSTDGHTALTVAAIRGHESAVLTLLDHGADIHACTDNGNTALDLAEMNGHTRVVRPLLERW